MSGASTFPHDGDQKFRVGRVGRIICFCVGSISAASTITFTAAMYQEYKLRELEVHHYTRCNGIDPKTGKKISG